jgi:crotonobetainyl-CoA:carnitine CoA-transferase CaiB-like acyl-CoA transferase
MDKLAVLEFEGLAPSVLCGLFFADLGAQVTIVARHQPQAFSIPIEQNIMNRNKSMMAPSFRMHMSRSQVA